MAPRKKAQPATPPVASAGEGAQAFLTDAQLAGLGLTPDVAASILADSSSLYTYVQKTPYATRDALVQWANSTWGEGAVDRLNAALGFLERSGKLASLNVG
jgi:hypothetical protein